MSWFGKKNSSGFDGGFGGGAGGAGGAGGGVGGGAGAGGAGGAGGAANSSAGALNTGASGGGGFGGSAAGHSGRVGFWGSSGGVSDGAGQSSGAQGTPAGQSSAPASTTTAATNFTASEAEFDALILKIRSICGIDLEVKRASIRPKLIKFAEQQGISSFAQLAAKIELNASVRQELFDLITVCETYFYRELKQLQELICHLRRTPSARRILCAPCSSGEEVYSILMLANEAGIKNLQITGIDLNEGIIAKARAGVYSKRSLYNLEPAIARRYFTEQSADEFAIRKELLAPASFRVCNVFGPEFRALGSFDVILSRNMMIYFNEEFKYKLVDIFCQQLNFEGLFFAGHADLVPAHEGFEKIFDAACTYYRKR